jgi:Rrf2 family protein
VNVSAKADYALRAVVELAAHEGQGPIKGDRIAQAQDIPWKFCENILAELRAAGLVSSRRGSDGGYWLSRAASDITLAEVIRVADGPLAAVRGVRPSEAEFPPASSALRDVWVAVRVSLRAVLDHVTVADVACKTLPEVVRDLLAEPGAWESPPLFPTESVDNETNSG